ncbi:Asp-tRNA(Asn)/Glu-tRNA(Gln) amidotransferase GatCAB subunit A [Bradyrhizobium sp. CSA112]|uniref:amidase n=1 Tax=Bradyrhizobium sp. CSA112 TaxID=2699170 RepID=UPI0023AEA125|nr:amidase [Bradyrhizobium sp. CSA112]MDE5456958.1 Asp-tRNA(Asn)/Glu-tRNA(Gln) amidotransferase GatCAB subunit A [Bradyrhizobium sp. CSA112]
MDVVTDDLHYLELTELAARIRDRKISPLEATRAQLDRIAALDGELGSYVQVMADAAMAQAEAAHAEIASGRYRGPLHGVPIAVKDLFWIKNVPTAAGTIIHGNFRPDQDATVVHRLNEAGAVVLGKLQLTEGAYSDHHPSVTPPRNPWNPDYWPGISSSGSAAATAAGLCYGSLASDTGGSIRWPCAANGLTGLKPSWGRVSRHGVFELAATLDHVGVIARSATDAGAMLGVIAGRDRADPTAVLDSVPDYLVVAEQDVRGLRIGFDAKWSSDGVDVATQQVLGEAIETMRALGADIVDVRFPDVKQAVADWVPNCAVEAAVAHDATYPARKDDYGPVLAAVIEAGRTLSALDYQRVLLRRLELRGRVASLFETIDLLLIPVHPFPPLTLAMIRTLGEQPDLIARLQEYTCPFNMTGHPTITLPGGFSATGMPIAFQLVAANLDEATLVRAGAAFQRVTSWHRRHPSLSA